MLASCDAIWHNNIQHLSQEKIIRRSEVIMTLPCKSRIFHEWSNFEYPTAQYLAQSRWFVPLCPKISLKSPGPNELNPSLQFSNNHLIKKSEYGLYAYSTVKPLYIRCTLVGAKIVDHSLCSWSIACRRCSNYILILDWTPGFNRLRKDNCKTRRETFNFWDLVWLILEVWPTSVPFREVRILSPLS